jgi:hypothetical protein
VATHGVVARELGRSPVGREHAAAAGLDDDDRSGQPVEQRAGPANL